MGRPKKIDYAAMFSYDGKKDLYYCTRSINGVKKRFYAKDAKDLYAKVQTALDRTHAPPSFEVLAEQWQDYKWPSLQENTKICYAPYLRNAIDELGDKLITDVTPADINRIILRMKDKGYSAKTVKTQKGVLKMIFDFAITRENAYVTFNPVNSITVPRGLPKEKRSSPDDDVMQIVIDNVDTATFGLFPYLLLHTGCRRGEALALTWGDIDFKNKQISITKSYTYPKGMPVLKTPKTEAGERKIDLLPGLQRRLIRPINARDSDLIFHSPDGRPLQENAFRRRWMHYCKDVGLVNDEPEERISKQGKRYTVHKVTPALTPHQLRHGYSTLLFESDVDPKTAQSLLGHADVHTTLQIYTDLRESHRKSQVDKISSYMEEKYGEVSTKEYTESAIH